MGVKLQAKPIVVEEKRIMLRQLVVSFVAPVKALR
jgi:hypothetical protein